MKILKLEFENINSLKGGWKIDFTDPSFAANDNLFAICGPTGSGKSTILDAITLAIYGATPRQAVIYQSRGNEVMTRDADSCFSRVTYQCSKGIFVSEWSQRRARTGTLQEAQGLVYALDNREVPLFDGKTDSKHKLAEVNSSLIQLDFSEFCRSIMLAQGEFSRFLNCKEEDRAKILEKLNGTEKYRRLAQKAAEKWSSARAEKEKCEAACKAIADNMLTPEQLAQKKAAADELQKEGEALAVSAGEVEKYLAWYGKLEERQALCETAGKNLSAAEEAVNSFAPQSAALVKGRRAQKCWGQLKQVNGWRDTIFKYKNEVAANRKSLAEFAGQEEQVRQELVVAQERQQLLKAKNQEDKKIWQTVRNLDEKINNSSGQVEKINNNYSCLAEKLANLQGERQKLEEEIGVLDQRVGKAEKYFAEHQIDEKLPLVLAESNGYLHHFLGLAATIDEEEQDLAAALKSIAELNISKRQLLDNIEKIEQKQLELFNNDMVAVAAILQKQLKAGSPCPVCGSLEHPACSGVMAAILSGESETVSDVAQKVRDLNRELQDANRKKDDLDEKLQKSELAGQSLEALLKNNREAFAVDEGKLTEIWRPWNEQPVTVRNSRDIFALLNKKEEDRQKFHQEHEKIKSELAEKNKRMTTILELMRDLEPNLKKAFAEKESGEIQLQNFIKERQDLFADQIVDLVEVAAQKELDKQQAIVDGKEKDLQALVNKISSLQFGISQRENDIQATESSLEQGQEELAALLSQNDFSSEAELQAAFIPDNELLKIEEHKKSLENNLLLAGQAAAEAQKDLESCQAEYSAVEDREVLRQKREEFLARQDAVQQELAAIRAELTAHANTAQNYQDQQERQEKAKSEFNNWDGLYTLLGHKANGDKFSTFVQGLTFKSLLVLANKKLHEIKGRYTLVPKGDLDFEIEDANFDGRRPVSNLSGGEKFLVSLALSLGIADFASRNIKMDSLFLDEGFGTLDSDLLLEVMECLKTQRHPNKMLGVITHVDLLKNEFAQKIQVEPLHDGHSMICGPGVSRMEPQAKAKSGRNCQ